MMFRSIFQTINVKKAILVFTTLLLVSFVASAVYIVRRENQVKQVIAAILVDTNEDGFLIVGDRTYDISRYIEIESASGWRQIFWGHKLYVQGQVKVSYGYDLQKARIEVKRPEYCVKLYLPTPEIYSVEVLEPIKIFNKTGILYTLTKQDHLRDYNLAVKVLKEAARSQLKKKELDSIAQEGLQNFLNRINAAEWLCDMVYNQ